MLENDSREWNFLGKMSNPILKKKSRLRETKHLLTDADSSTTAKKLLNIFLSLPAAIALPPPKGLLRKKKKKKKN